MLTKWLEHWHGVGATHQHQFYRCVNCRSIVTWHGIRSGGCGVCKGSKVSPTGLTLWEKFKALVLPWTL